MDRARAGRTRRRILIAVLALIVLSPGAFLVAYRIVAKKALSGPLLRAEINKKPKDLLIEWDEAVSTWPGRVTVKNLSIRGSDPNVQWIVLLPEASLKYALTPLLRRTFVVTELRPKSIQFRIRQKLAPGKVSEEHLESLPPIPGFGDVPLKVEGEKLPAPEPNPFTIEVEDVATDAFDDIWFDGFRYRGPGALRGSFRLKPGYRAQIGPASLTLSGGELTLGDVPAVTKLEGKVEATFEDWNVQELLDAKVWKVVTAKAELSGPIPGVDFLDRMVSLGPGVHISGGPGRLSIAGSIDHGTAAGSVEIVSKQGKYVRPGLALVGSADARVEISNFVLDGGAPEIGGTALKVTDVFVAGAAKGTKGWWGEFRIPSGRMSKGLSGRVALKCSDGRPLLAFLGEALPKWTKGLIDLEGLTVSAADLVLSEPRSTVRGLEAQGGNFTVQGELDRRGETIRGAFLIESGILILGVELDGGKTIVRPFLARQWYAKAGPAVFETAKASPAKTAGSAKGGSKSAK